METTERRPAKIRALLNKAESTSFPEEAEALTAKALQLVGHLAHGRSGARGGRPAARAAAVVKLQVPLGSGPYVRARFACWPLP
ncbi:MAG: DUF2786 domain-containing protein [Acidimicrobiales bacterium]